MEPTIAESARRKMYEEMGQLVNVPTGHTVAIVPEGATVPISSVSDCIRITDNPNAPGCMVVDKYKIHPYRQKELVARLATRLPTIRVTTHDIRCIRKVHAAVVETDGYVWIPPHSSPHYSEQMVDWIVAKISDDSGFLERTRDVFRSEAAA